MKKDEHDRNPADETRPADQAGSGPLHGSRGDTDDTAPARNAGGLGWSELGAKSNRQSAAEKRLLAFRQKRAEELALGKANTATARAVFWASDIERRAALTEQKRDLLLRARVGMLAVRAKKFGCAGSHTTADIQRLIDRQQDECALCQKAMDGLYHVDHIVPMKLRGSNGPENLQILCPLCNMKKGCKEKP